MVPHHSHLINITLPLTPHPHLVPFHKYLVCFIMNSLFAGEEFVERTSRGHLHDQHQVLSVAQTQHADDEGVTQLVHDLRLPHHLLLHQLLVVTLQHLDGHIDLAPERKQTFWMNV